MEMKKGIFFSILSIILVTMLISGIFIAVNYELSDNFDNEKKQIQIMNRIVKNIDNDLGKAAHIITFRALLAQLTRITENGTYINDYEEAFNELAFNGTLYGEANEFMENNTFYDWLNNFNERIKNSNFEINLEFIDFTVTQNSPWTIEGVISTNLSLTHKKGYASWNKVLNSTESISLIGFEDPISTVETYGRILLSIEPSNVTNWDASQVKNAMETGIFIASNKGSNYLNRLEGSLSPNSNGIEYFVNPSDLSGAGLEALIYNRSYVDHEYWGSSEPTIYSISGITNSGYPTFKLDNETVYAYNLENNTY